MSDQEELPTKDGGHALNVTQCLIEFIHRFDTRTTDPDVLRRILKGKNFRGGVVGQAPEFFTEQYLIVPVLNALGFNEIRWRPVDLTKAERKEPDFRIDDSHSEIVCIVESKRLGREIESESASKQIKEYLVDNTFVKYAKNQDHQYLVGIGTDGLGWTLYAKPIGEQELIDIGSISIRDELRTLRRAQRCATRSNSSLARNISAQLEESLIPIFANHNLHSVVTEEVTNRY